MLIHIFLGIKKGDAQTPITYITILGMNEKGKNYIRQNKKKFLLPITIDKTSKIYFYERNATLLYDLVNETNTKEFFFKTHLTFPPWTKNLTKNNLFLQNHKEIN